MLFLHDHHSHPLGTPGEDRSPTHGIDDRCVCKQEREREKQENLGRSETSTVCRCYALLFERMESCYENSTVKERKVGISI